MNPWKEAIGWFGTNIDYASGKWKCNRQHVQDGRGLVVNGFGLFASNVHSLPILLAQTNEIHDFAFNLARTDIIF